VKSAKHCVEHKKDNEIDLTNRKRLCRVPNCDKRATYGKKRYQGEHCASHKEVNEFDINSIRCEGCGLFTVSKRPYLCEYCKPESAKRKKTKEMLVVKFFQEQEMKFIHNKSVGASCGSYRPDLLFDAGTHFVVVEVDENQHKNIASNDRYGNICERVRENNIFIALGLPTVFIRYNPDACRIDGTLIRVVTTKRLEKLLERVKYHMNTVPEEHMVAEFLFYDDYEKRTSEYKSVDATKLAEFQQQLGL
jgi:hypothetical protein